MDKTTGVYLVIYQDAIEGFDRMHIDEFFTLEDALKCQEAHGGVICKKLELTIKDDD